MAEDGGPAYPAIIGELGSLETSGMSMLNWYAGRALGQPELSKAYRSTPAVLAKHMYDIAEAMIAEGERRMKAATKDT